MLAEKQLSWLLKGLAQSSATWKIIASSVPLSAPTGSMAWLRGRDGWASGYLFTGFETELLKIVDFIRTHPVHNVVWVTTDVHFAQFTAYDPDKDGAVDFHELVSGPLSAILGEPEFLDSTLNPQVLYQGSGFYNFGVVRIDGQSKDLTAEIRDQRGARRFTLTLKAAKP
jgi:alkaline phosphatase D